MARDSSGLAEDTPSSEGINLSNASPKIRVNLLDAEDCKLWNVGSHKIPGHDRLGNIVPKQPLRGATLISEHIVPGAAIKWALAFSFGEFRAEQIAEYFYERMTTILVPKRVATLKTLNDNRFTGLLRNWFLQGASGFHPAKLIDFGKSNLLEAVEASGADPGARGVRNIDKASAMQARQIFGAFSYGDALRNTDHRVDWLLARDLVKNYVNPFKEMENKAKALAYSAAETAPRALALAGQTMSLALAVNGAQRAAYQFEDRLPPKEGAFGIFAKDVRVLGFFLAETLAGLVDDAAAGAKAVEFGDWYYAEYMMNEYMNTGMSPAQRDLLNYLAPP